jgi:hypothetical protein
VKDGTARFQPEQGMLVGAVPDEAANDNTMF